MQYIISRLTVQIQEFSLKYQGCYCHEKAIKKLCCHVHEDISSTFLELWQIFKIICSHWRKIFVIYISPGLQNRKMLQFQFCMLQSMAYARFLAFCCNGWQLLVLGFFVDCWATSFLLVAKYWCPQGRHYIHPGQQLRFYSSHAVSRN